MAVYNFFNIEKGKVTNKLPKQLQKVSNQTAKSTLKTNQTNVKFQTYKKTFYLSKKVVL